MNHRAHHAPIVFLNRSILWLALGALLFAGGCQKLKARDQLNKGVQAYKSNRFEQAIEHFKNAINQDPQLSVAKLYLATACAAQYVPGADNEENVRNAECALDNFKKVLESEPGNILSLKGIASLYFSMKKFEEAKEWHRKAIAADPQDPDNYYSVAVIDWTQSYVPRTETRQALGITDAQKGITDRRECRKLREAHWEQVEEGIQMLNKALELRQDYDDAMAYMNLLYRERAEYQCDDPEARQADLKLADEWVEKAKTTRQAKAEKAKEQHGIVLDQPSKQ